MFQFAQQSELSKLYAKEANISAAFSGERTLKIRYTFIWKFLEHAGDIVSRTLHDTAQLNGNLISFIFCI